MLCESTERVFNSTNGASKDDYYRCIRKSFFISADMAHAIHPNYADKHQPQHHPKIHEGVVIKMNANQRYMTDSVSASILRVLAAKSEVPIQDFIVK